MSPNEEPLVPSIISMEIDDDNETESEYRLRIGHRVKYLKVAAATFDRATLSFPIAHLPPLPYEDDSWTVASISRNVESGQLRTSLSGQQLAGVRNIWHGVRVDVLNLSRVERLTAATFEAVVCESTTPSMAPPPPSPPPTVIAKIARFEWEIPRIERETRAYQLLQQREPDLAPRFLGHIHEGGRVMGFMLEKLEDRRDASIGDLDECERALGKFHGLGMLHGDVNRYNFLVGTDGVKLIDFERFEEDAAEEGRAREMQSLRAEFVDQSGRGAGFVFSG
ncbi:alpha-galactosidase A [Melanomma pulvis-pyrius CBS 109.77]|uniref:Alpha-galactosidase A n=1 Tax=Melanomma pulvis-pyrius CBS 109.77 TaxID=1314802 RepID=A0A6A6WZG0_9PLEO|nr:alpha-galactosidase A [Melanomma pulvis-pyrius CBS 109.77]